MGIVMRYHKKEGDTCCILQLEYGSGKANEGGKTQKKDNKQIKNKGQTFSISDENTLRIISSFL